MRTFSCLTTDRRYTAPTLSFLIVADEQRAVTLARQRLLESEHYLAVELYEDGRELLRESREQAFSTAARP